MLCEKPIALNVKEIDRINLEINKSNKIFSEAFMVYYHPQWKKVKELILNGEIGELKHVQGCFTYFNIDPKPRNFIHPNGIKKIHKVKYGNEKKLLKIINEMCNDETLYLQDNLKEELIILEFE